MPGTIQVSVLEFKGNSSSSDPSAASLKVSMGKRYYQTWDKGDFSFPITKLSEDLAVTLLDAGGNEIAYTGIQTMQIIQKGSWDEIFSFEGGRLVHLKLQFALNEEERNRIRVMRESAMKKNLETAPNTNIRLSESTSSTRESEETSAQSEQNVSDSLTKFKIEVVSRQVEASQADSSLNSDVSSVGSTSSYQKEDGSILESEIPNAADRSQNASSSTVIQQSPQVQESVPCEKIETNLPLADIRSVFKEALSVPASAQDDSVLKSEDQGSLEKTPSNVRKMINAFESGQLQDVKSLKSALPVQPQLNIVGKESSLEDQDEMVVSQSTDQSLRKFEDTFLTGNLHQNLTKVSRLADFVLSDTKPSQAPKELESSVTQFSPIVNDSNIEDDITRVAPTGLTVAESNRSPVDLMRQSTSETATSSGRKHEEQSQEVQAYNSSNSSAAEGKESGTGSGFECSTIIDIQGTSDQKQKSLDYYREQYYSSESSGVWIFPHNTRRLCITTASNQVMKIVGLHHIEASTHQEKEISSESEILEKDAINEKIANLPESGCGSSPDDSHKGLVGQVIKIAVILGFGVLVLLTRKKEPRSKREENDVLFGIQDYIDERTLTE